ncbi:MAG: hypothetical protein VX776_10545, partial [Planctomycetota bacterium]|nr:hypothetical protein [Planctomycetota bacterium]
PNKSNVAMKELLIRIRFQPKHLFIYLTYSMLPTEDAFSKVHLLDLPYLSVFDALKVNITQFGW